MKKVLLSCGAFFTVLSSFAQSNVDNLPQGYHPDYNYAKDYFTTVTEPSNSPKPGGVYWWSQKTTGPKLDTVKTTVGKTCVWDSAYFKYTTTRQGDGSFDYALWQPYGKYEPVGVGFGFTHHGTDSSANVLDLSKDATVAFTITNSSDYDLTVKVLLQDIYGHTLNSLGANTGGTTYMDEVLFPLPALSAVDASFTDNDGNTVPINFIPEAGQKAYYANYPLDACGIGGTPVHDTIFDYTQVVGVLITVVNSLTAGSADGYKPYELDSVTFAISKFFVGNTSAVVGLADNFLAKPTFKVYPNPVSNNGGIVNFEMEVKDVKVMNGVGQVVYSAPSASSLNVTNYQKGLYVIQSSRGASRFVVE